VQSNGVETQLSLLGHGILLELGELRKRQVNQR